MNSERKVQIRKTLEMILQGLISQVRAAEIPSLSLTSRSKKNIVYNPEKRVWILGSRKTRKTCKTMGGSKEVLRLANMIAFLLEQLESGKANTLRNMYYIAMNWIEEARFEQVSNTAEALENLQIITGMLREELGIVPDISGALFGPIVLRAKTRVGWKTIHCAEDVSQAGFAIPPRMEDYEILEVRARVVIAIETGGMYQRFIQDGVDKRYNAAFIHTKGQSSRATRILIRKIKEKNPDIPILGFHDADPWGIGIMENIATGSIKSSHLSERLCTPDMVSIGLFPSQIPEYGIPSVRLTKREVKRVQQMLQDPRYQRNSRLLQELKFMQEHRIKAEQQALAVRGISFVTEEFLPDQLKKLGIL